MATLTTTDEAVLFYLCDEKKTFREIAQITNKAVSTLRESATKLIKDGYMTGKKSAKGYYLSRSYKYTSKGAQRAK